MDKLPSGNPDLLRQHIEKQHQGDRELAGQHAEPGAERATVNEAGLSGASLPKGEFKKSDDDPVTAHKSQDQDHPTTIPHSDEGFADKPRAVQEKQQRG